MACDWPWWCKSASCERWKICKRRTCRHDRRVIPCCRGCRKGVSSIAGKKDIPTYTFDQLLNYDLLEDDETITTGGVGQALVGGALFGGFGAIAGGVTAKRKNKRVVNSITIKLTLNDFNEPCIMIPLLEKPVKVKSKEYEIAYNTAQKMLSMLDVITHNS